MSEPTQAAPPLLASNLLAAAKVHESSRPAPASSGSAVIDEEALSGGFIYGEITSIAGANGPCKTLLAYHATASHLLKDSLGEVAFIDTTGSFSPLRLRDVLVFRLEAKAQREGYEHSGYMYERASSKAEETKQGFINEATALLDRVKVMRVFDLAGVIEAVAEVGEMRETVTQASVKPASIARRAKDEVSDSEKELEEEDEFAFGPAAVQGEQVAEPQGGQVGIIVIDTITNVVSSLMSKGQTQGQALLTSFMRTLYHLTSRHHICTILTNAAVALTSSNNPEYKRRPEDNVSIFSSTMGKPALGKTFTYLIDTSVFLSEIPKTMNDAATAFDERMDGAPFRKAFVLEVLKDRCGMREGRWVAFDILDEFKVVPCRS
ncbi:hypothetical protein N7G274_004293 [Stereocaulon virgatum]|uniref:RecA family profile 1 domain-containing protein n=1 Tax=Stereocaulon virgatum TaxID=373712 RepID=A0ABR4ADT7_9LECA